MPFTVRDFHSLVRLLEQRPEWRAELRRLLLSREILTLPRLVRQLSADVQKLQETVARLAEAQERTERELAESRAQAEQRFARLEEAITRLTEAQERAERELAESRAQVDRRFARLEEAFARLTEAQERTGERVARLEEVSARLAEAQERTERELAESRAQAEQRFARLAEAQERTERELAESRAQAEQRFARLEEAFARLTEAQERTEETVQGLVETVATLVGEVGALKGENLERRYRERAASYFQRILRRIRLVDHQQLGLLLDDALDQGRITPEERARVLEADVVVAGLFDGQEVYLLAEVSATVTADDVRRARERAAALEKATGRRVLAAVAGQQLSDDAKTREEAVTVWQVLDGRVSPPA